MLVSRPSAPRAVVGDIPRKEAPMSPRTSRPSNRLLTGGISLALLAGLSGCGAIEQVANMPSSSQRRATMRKREVAMRDRYAEKGDTKAIRWLLANVVEEGMEVEEVSRILGQQGEYVAADNFVKTKNSGFHVDDKTYRWGPDDHGRAYFLVFRDRQLVNHTPAQYAAIGE